MQMITLHTLPAAFGLRNPSPFCLKVEMALTHLNLDFDIVTEANPQKAPKGKMPWLVDAGAVIPDSELILDYLDKKTGGGLFSSVTPEEVAVGTAFTRLAEDHLYWIGVASRWLDDDWFPVVRRDFFGFVPAPIGWLVSTMARRQVRQTYHLHGLGRHSHEEQMEFARKDLNAIASQTTTHGYIAGNRLTPYDFSVASMLAGLIDNQPATWVSELANNEFPEGPRIRRASTSGSEGILPRGPLTHGRIEAPAFSRAPASNRCSGFRNPTPLWIRRPYRTRRSGRPWRLASDRCGCRSTCA